MMCRDRFRIELTATDIKYYINGFLYFEDGNWPAGRQIDMSAGPWYVYDTDWEDTHTSPAFRYHWDNFSVNPHQANGQFTVPSAAPNFCLGQPMNVCADSATPTPVPTSPAATATVRAVPTNTTIPVATSTPVMVSVTSTPVVSGCSAVLTLNGTPTVYTRQMSECANQ